MLSKKVYGVQDYARFWGKCITGNKERSEKFVQKFV